MDKKEIGKIMNYYQKINVAVIELSEDLDLNEYVEFVGAHTNFQQKAESMQIDNKPIDKASSGEQIAMKVDDRVRINDLVYKIDT
ncbi:MAG: translation elongation factor-like protein [Candidatus Kariarchaeaceae archaeon]|jgi:putative protease